MRIIRLYPEVARQPRQLKGKRFTVPDQAMSLKEMFRRFIRREPLPAEKQAAYIESDYDLEKVANLDIVEKNEVLSEMKQDVNRKKKRLEDAQAQAEAAQKKRDDEAEADMRARIEKQKDPKEFPSKQP